ncbi:hypothetical protein [Phycicoccus avicenniae]|uniref:hypothetical protein n=1 Tax=Phycicoccus avicenniae TaxID=2828860 RepID=UPI003D2A35D2
MDTAGLVQLDDPGAVRASGTEVVAAFRAVRDRSREVRASWLGLVGYYTAPEQGEVLAAMEVPVTEADAAADKAAVVARALSAYGDRLEQLRAQRQALVADMDAFTADRASIDAEDRDNNVLESAWDAITGEQEQLLHRENALNERAAQLLADKEAAERDCANAIGDIWGGEHYEAGGETWAGDTTTYGMTAEAYVAMSRSGDAPWGHPVMWDSDNWLVRTNMLLGGASESVTGAVGFFGDLFGADGSGRAKAGWSGLWQLAQDASRFASPGSAMGSFASDPQGSMEASQRLLTVGKGIVAWDDWDTSGWYAGGSVGLDVITAIGTGGSAAAVKGGIKGAAATRFARLLEVGAAVDVRAAAAASRVRLGSVLSARLDDFSALGERAASRLRLPGLEPAGVPRSLLDDTSAMRREADAPAHPRTDHPDLTSRGPGAPDHPTTRPFSDHPAPHDATPEAPTHPDGPADGTGPRTTPTSVDTVDDAPYRSHLYDPDNPYAVDNLITDATRDLEPWRQRMEAGQEFNRINHDRYPVNELRLDNGKVLDSYDPASERIVSRKHTDLSFVRFETAKGYLDEVKAKYDTGETIADTPANHAMLRRAGLEDLIGTKLDGALQLEVPPHTRIPDDVLRYSDQIEVDIVDVTGRNYTQEWSALQ